MSDFCADKGEDGKEDSPNEDILNVELWTWKMYFNRAVNQYRNGIGVLLIIPKGSLIPLAIKLNFKATNNMAEYEACIARMEALRELRVKKAWKNYQQYLEDLTKTFDKIEYIIIPRAQNQFTDALATLASMVEIPGGVWTRSLQIKQSYEEVHKGKTEASVMTIGEEEVPWYYDIMKFLELGAYPDGADKKKRHSIRMMAT